MESAPFGVLGEELAVERVLLVPRLQQRYQMVAEATTVGGATQLREDGVAGLRFGQRLQLEDDKLVLRVAGLRAEKWTHS